VLSKLSAHVRNNVVGYIALFFALTGVAYAAVPLKSGDPAGGDLTGTYPNPSIAANAVDSGKVADGAITPAKLNAGLQFTDVGLPEMPILGAGCPPGANGWYNNFQNAVDQRVGYARDPFGVVHLRGVAINCTSSGVCCPTVFQLPAGFRPDLPPGGVESFAGLLAHFEPGAFSVGRVDVRGAGRVEVGGVAVGDGISFSGITFRCGPSDQNGCP
jgi:hypothetical protein